MGLPHARMQKRYEVFLYKDRKSVLGYYANCADPVQTPQNPASDQGIQCLVTRISMQNAM